MRDKNNFNLIKIIINANVSIAIFSSLEALDCKQN